MARRRHHEEHQNHEAWAIPYGDLITLLLAFFVVMYAISSVNEGKYRVLSDALVAAFRGTPMTLEPVQVGEKQMGSGADIQVSLVQQELLAGQPRDLFAPLPLKPIDAVPGRDSGRSAGNGGPAGTDAGDAELEAVTAEVSAAMRELIERGLVAVRRRQASVEVEIRADILFSSGSATLTPQAVAVIDRIAAVLARFPNPVVVEGHTDDRPISTVSFPSNWELSAGRAASVVHLLTQHGIDGSRLTVIGLGEFRPAASNDTPDGRNANRRVLLVVRGTMDAATPAHAPTAPVQSAPEIRQTARPQAGTDPA